MTPIELLDVTRPGSDLNCIQETRVRIVRDPKLGNVVVRWRYLLGNHDTAPRWRCAGCGTRSDRADGCEHIFSAALDLAAEMFGLVAAGVPAEPTPTESRNAS